jgi:hypothetical protein
VTLAVLLLGTVVAEAKDNSTKPTPWKSAYSELETSTEMLSKLAPTSTQPAATILASASAPH